jgi:hypothetical protein
LASTCTACATNSLTLATGQTDISASLCILGYTGQNGGTCVACVAGKYKTGTGVALYADCGAGKYLTTTGAILSSSCVDCGAGKYSTTVGASLANTCIDCALSTYSAAVGATLASTCTACAANSLTLATGQTDISACLCALGYTGQDGGVCSPCTTGSYKPILGSLSCAFCPANHYGTSIAAVFLSSCVACPTNSLSQAGSGRIELCVCESGFKQTAEHDACIECSPGYYDDTTDRYECSLCGGGLYSATPGATGIETCQECPADTWSPAGSASCESCPDNSNSLARSFSQTDCECNAGATGANGATCVLCREDEYKASAGSAECEDCPENSLSASGSSECQCSSGYTGPFEACSLCAAGKYKSAAGEGDCTSCPAHSFSTPGSVSVEACVCDSGYTGADGECSACPPGKHKQSEGSSVCLECAAATYSASAGSALCTDCPISSSSPPGSFSQQDCACLRGHTGRNGEACVQCAAGQYKAAPGDGPCLLCPPGEISALPGSDACSRCPEHEIAFGGTTCECEAGYSRQGDVCVACPAATFKERAGDSEEDSNACSVLAGCCSCRANSNTLAAASVHSSACLCLPGYGGEACMPCDTGLYKTSTSDDECQQCPEGATTEQQRSSAEEDCVAARGHYGSQSVGFIPCASGLYAPTTAMASCILCPIGATSPPASPSVLHCECVLQGWSSVGNDANTCTCQAGYARDTNNLCQECSTGFFCSGGDIPAQQCPEYSSSAAGAVLLSQCMCDAGHSGVENSLSCTVCAASTYKTAIGAAVCSCIPCLALAVGQETASLCTNRVLRAPRAGGRADSDLVC